MGNVRFDYTGRVLAITGASGGIGKGIAVAFAKAGAKVVIGDLKEEEGRATAEEIAASGGTVSFIQTDVSKDDSVKAFIQHTLDSYGQLDILVNGAGVGHPNKGLPFTNIQDLDFDITYQVNLMGSVRTCRAVYDHMKERGYGRIINVTSVVWRSTNPINTPYVTSKAASASLVLNLAKELGPYGVTVNNLCPGYVLTPMYENSFGRISPLIPGFTGSTAEDMVDHYAKLNCATTHKQTSQEVADAAMFLASDEAASITGIALDVAGGYKL